jgi:hypothetical protein
LGVLQEASGKAPRSTAPTQDNLRTMLRAREHM